MSEAKQPKLLLVDGNALIHRAYHALPSSMTTSSGEPTNAIYGFAVALIHAFETLHPTHAICCFDVEGGTFRHTEFKEYKAHRKAMDDDLAKQVPRIHELVKALAIPVITKRGYEADDLIGTLAKRFKHDAQVLILTGDKDALQLIDKSVSIVIFKQGVKEMVTYTPEALHEQYGLTADEFIVFKALRGDPSDNIPGVSGVGEVTALKLVQTYHTIPGLYTALAEKPANHPLLKGHLRDNLLNERKIAELSLRLATIDRDVPIAVSFDQAKLGGADNSHLMDLLEALEFRSLLPKMSVITGTTITKVQANTGVEYEVVDEHQLAKRLTGRSRSIGLSVLRSEGDILSSRIVAVAIALEGQAVVVGRWNASIGQKVKELLSDTEIEKYMSDYKWLTHLGWNHTFKIALPVTDDLLLAQLLQVPPPDAIKPTQEPISDDLLKGIANQAADNVSNGHRLSISLKQAKQVGVWQTIERPLVPVIAQMERTGVLIDIEILKEAAEESEKEIAHLQKEITHLVGQDFNIASPQQVGVMLYDKLGLATDGVKKRSRGLSTDAATLESLKGTHPVIDLILRYRELTKLKGTYIDALPKLVSPITGRLHTTYNQLGAATGRLSSSDPNLQNIPIRTRDGGALRRAFVAPVGRRLLSLDYSQIELRILAHLSGDKAMKHSFISGIDIHAATAANLYSIPLDQVTKEMRHSAKAVNFGLLYGLSAHSLSKQLGLSYKTAEQFMERYFASYPKVRQFLTSVVEQGRKEGCLYTLFGRRRLIPDLNSNVWALRQAAERIAMNFPMQGTQADILKKAMIAIGDAYHDDEEVKLILSVHDELVFEVTQDRVTEVAEHVRSIMTGVCELDVPLVVSAKSGQNWLEMTEV